MNLELQEIRNYVLILIYIPGHYVLCILCLIPSSKQKTVLYMSNSPILINITGLMNQGS